MFLKPVSFIILLLVLQDQITGGIQYIQQSFRIEPVLKQVIYGTPFQTLTYILEIIISAYSNNLDLGIILLNVFNQFNTVHYRHIHIRNHNIGCLAAYNLNCIGTVCSFTADLKPVFIPINKSFYTCPCSRIIIYNQNFLHCIPAPLITVLSE